jgi:hypothetical protein
MAVAVDGDAPDHRVRFDETMAAETAPRCPVEQHDVTVDAG